jgi:hypothetical protein
MQILGDMKPGDSIVYILHIAEPLSNMSFIGDVESVVIEGTEVVKTATYMKNRFPLLKNYGFSII